MPVYDFRCQSCQGAFSLRFKRVADYAAAETRCPACDSSRLTRVIQAVSIASGERDYRKLSSNEMLSVLESGDKSQVETMFTQVTGSADGLPADDKTTD